MKKGERGAENKNRLERWHWGLTGEKTSSVHWGCYHGSEVPGNRTFQLNSLPIPQQPPHKASSSLGKTMWKTIKIIQFLADFAIGSTRLIPRARLSSNGRARGVAAMATQLPCPFTPSVSWGRSLEKVVPHLLHQGRDIAKDTQVERSLRECSL